jgi:hypothetical protein
LRAVVDLSSGGRISLQIRPTEFTNPMAFPADTRCLWAASRQDGQTNDTATRAITDPPTGEAINIGYLVTIVEVVKHGKRGGVEGSSADDRSHQLARGSTTAPHDAMRPPVDAAPEVARVRRA